MIERIATSDGLMILSLIVSVGLLAAHMISKLYGEKNGNPIDPED